MTYVVTDGGLQGNLMVDRVSYPSYPRRVNPNVSWGEFADDEFLASNYDMFRLVQDQAPPYDPSTQRRITLSSSYDTELGGWKGNYLVEDIPQAELDAAEQSRKEGVLNDIRAQRDQRLRESDWIMTIDAPILNKNQWAVYRQLLRDVMTQNPNPDLIILPTAPPIIPSGEKASSNYFGVFNPLGSPAS